MPVVRRMSPDEVAGLRRRGARVDLSPYRADLDNFAVGEWGVIQLEATDRVTAIKRRYTVAGKEQGKLLIYKRPRNGTIPFEVRSLAAAAKRAAAATVRKPARAAATATPKRSTTRGAAPASRSRAARG